MKVCGEVLFQIDPETRFWSEPFQSRKRNTRGQLHQDDLHQKSSTYQPQSTYQPRWWVDAWEDVQPVVLNPLVLRGSIKVCTNQKYVSMARCRWMQLDGGRQVSCLNTWLATVKEQLVEGKREWMAKCWGLFRRNISLCHTESLCEKKWGTKSGRKR